MTGTNTFVISEPLCAPYCKLLLNDFPAETVRKEFGAKNKQADFSELEPKLDRFYDGLANSRLELAGSLEDVSGWLLCYIEAYIDPEDPDVPFHDWNELSAAEQQAVRADAARISPILRSV